MRVLAALALRTLDNYKLKCGLEIHTQLNTKYKLFSLSESAFSAPANTNVSFFDAGLPGTQPALNPEALKLALRAAAALQSTIQTKSLFDRKHYFYQDQPLGYQITQKYAPLALDGKLVLRAPLDEINEPFKIIRIQQIQIEQDTGRSHYSSDGKVDIDLNRANTPLIEMVTHPDFDDILQVKAFVKKYQLLVKHIGVCTGELETGAIRVDVNVSVNGNSRVEIKNMRSTTDILNAIEFEYFRQVDLIENGLGVPQETRGWTGTKTVLLRSKEDAVDYRYLPDSELPIVYLDSQICEQVKESLPELPDAIAEKLISAPYNLPLKLARFLLDNKDQLDYYLRLAGFISEKNLPLVLTSNWLFNDIPRAFKKLNLPIDLDIVDPEVLLELIYATHTKIITGAASKQALVELLKNPSQDIQQLIKTHHVEQEDLSDAITELCQLVVDENPKTVEKILNSNPNALKFLVGQAMKKSRGRADPKSVEEKLRGLLNIE